MQDFEVLPVGTTQYIKDLELELSVFREEEKRSNDYVLYKAATEIVWFADRVKYCD